MRALVVRPGIPNSMRLAEVGEPPASDGDVLVETLAIGICGTDREIAAGQYGTAPDGSDLLIVGHESLGRVLEAPSSSDLRPRDLVMGIVRRPDPVPCPACGRGEWDMCRNGRYTERGIKERSGYASERFRIESEFAVRLDPALGEFGVLVEPTSIVAKAWEQIERIGRRSVAWRPRTVLVTGAGPIGLLAALLARQRGYDLHVLDRAKEGPKPELVRALGGTYHCGGLDGLEPDVIVECTGAPSVILDAMDRVAPDGLVCLAGVSSAGHEVKMDLGGLNRSLVLENNVVFGTVNANRRHYEAAAASLACADRDWVARLITRRVPLDSWQDVIEKRDGDIKVVLQFAA